MAIETIETPITFGGFRKAVNDNFEFVKKNVNAYHCEIYDLKDYVNTNSTNSIPGCEDESTECMYAPGNGTWITFENKNKNLTHGRIYWDGRHLGSSYIISINPQFLTLQYPDPAYLTNHFLKYDQNPQTGKFQKEFLLADRSNRSRHYHGIRFKITIDGDFIERVSIIRAENGYLQQGSDKRAWDITGEKLYVELFG